MPRSAAILALLCFSIVPADAQRGQQTASAKAAAPTDLTGYWTAVITEDWHVRMPTAARGDFGSGAPGAVGQSGAGRLGTGANPSEDGNIPYNVTAAKLAMSWDPARDDAEGNQCKAYGAPGIMRQPTHLRISWQDDNTLKMEADFGSQTRLFHFVPPVAGGQGVATPRVTKPAGVVPTWQGYSVAAWTRMGGGGGQTNFDRGGTLKVITTDLKPGYYWKNGMPYSGSAVLTENFLTLSVPNGDVWMTVTQLVEDPEYLTEPFVVNYHFKKLPDGSKWNPTPCRVK
jgi:hypothetical protein